MKSWIYRTTYRPFGFFLGRWNNQVLASRVALYYSFALLPFRKQRWGLRAYEEWFVQRSLEGWREEQREESFWSEGEL